ncbi:MAG: hypothetical protein U9O98_05930, partial [Asgard group archaeon]|nr:hypothetical protein [Asgard group archaeon]
EEKKAIEELFDCTSDDIVAFIIGPPKEVEQAIIELKVRLRDAFDGVPNETRHANEDGTSKFQRYLGGANRMYPDTDSKPIPITPKHLQKIADNLPELPRTREKRYRKDLQLPDEIAKNLAISTKASLFDDLVKMGVEPITAAVTLEQTLKALKRDDVPIEKLTDERIKDIFGLLVENKITKDALEDIFTYLANNPSKSLNKALDALELHPLEKQDVIDLINKLLFENKKLVLEKKEKAFNSLMGELMDEIRGQFDGQKANELLKEQIENFLETEIDE